MLQIVSSIYSDRVFSVADGSKLSKKRHQAAGISQGYPLSPLVFVMVMTVLMADAASELAPEHQKLLGEGRLLSLMHADDTLIVGYQEESRQAFLDAVAWTERDLVWSHTGASSNYFKSTVR